MLAVLEYMLLGIHHLMKYEGEVKSLIYPHAAI